MSTLIRTILEKVSIHGFAYIPRRDLHLFERIFWGIVVTLVAYLSTSICWNQWERYKESPTVFGVERIIGTREFPYVGITLCTNYFDEDEAAIIINNTWNVGPNDKKFNYYKQFLYVLVTIRYNNLEILQPYQRDNSLNKVPILKFIWDLRRSLYANQTLQKVLRNNILEYTTKTNRPKTDKRRIINNVITEVGMCVTTSLLYEYQNPLGFVREPERILFQEMCSPFDVCNIKVSPLPNDGLIATAYIHHNRDIVPQDDRAVIRREMVAHQLTDIDVELKVLSAEREVRNVPIRYRKCRFADENNLKYFKTYRPILCRNECRINAALKLCNCKPFFYVVGEGPTCTVDEMLCLAKANWKDTKCEECVELCSVMEYIALKTTVHNYSATRFERSLLINLVLPKMGRRRRVVFSTDQLVMAFGGAASLFLGCSFLSFAQILYYCIQALVEKFKRWYSRF